jgi:dihydroorotate dehydrogenase
MRANPLARRETQRDRVPRGISLGKSRDAELSAAAADQAAALRPLAELGDYVALNVSSPNTPGLRALQSVERLRPLLSAVQEALGRVKPGAPPPLLVKIAPDLSDEAVDEIGDLALDLGLHGIIATNTTTSREGLSTAAHVVQKVGPGGLSGAPVRLRSLSVLRRLRRRVGDRIVLIAAGGIETADDAWERIRAGATLVQIYTGFVYEGPLLAHRIAQGLLARARGLGFSSIQAAVGTGADRPSLAPPLAASSSAATSSV